MTTLNFNFHDKQMAIFKSDARFKVVGAGRRGGKTFYSVASAIILGLQKDGANIFHVAPTLQQARDTAWNLYKELGKQVIEKVHENTSTLTLVNGSTITLKGSDRPDTLRGVSLSHVILDEMAFMKAEVWDLIIRPALADQKGTALFIGTPDGKNSFYDLWVKAGKPENEEWEAFHFCSVDNPKIDPKEIEEARKTMPSKAFRQEFLASFEAAGGGAFKESDIQYLEEDEPFEGTVYIAVDLAGFGEGDGMVKSSMKKLDETAITVAKVGPTGWVIEDVIHGRWGIRETSLQIIKAAQKYRPACVGIEKGSLYNAVIPYLEDQMRRLGVYPRIEPLTHGGKKKTERIVWALQGRFEHGRIWLRKGEWNRPFTEQLLGFPNPLMHDDLIDSAAYIDQLATTIYEHDWNVVEEEPVLDLIAGY